MSLSMDDDRPYYYRLRGRALGPFSLQQMRQKAAAAQVNSRSDVSRDGLDWGKASDYPEIFLAEGKDEPTRVVSVGEWYYSVGGSQQGPVDLSVLQQYVASGAIKPTDNVFKEGMAGWLPVQNVPELAMVIRPPKDVNGTHPPPPGVNGLAIAGFVCSLLGCFCCTAIVGLVLSLVALSGTNQANRGLAIAGAIIGGIWLLLWLVYFGFLLIGLLANMLLAF